MIIEDKSAERSALNEDFDIAIPFSLRLAAGESEPEITVYPSLARAAKEFAERFTTPDAMLSREAIIWARDAAAPFLCANLFVPDKENEDSFIDYKLTAIDPSLVKENTIRLDGDCEYENLTGYDLEAMNEFGHICFGVVVDGKVVSAACTNSPVFDDEGDEQDGDNGSETSGGIEIGVETAEGYEGMGYGTSACAALALYLESVGRYALYEAESQNLGSIAIARKLGAEEIARSFCVVGTKQY